MATIWNFQEAYTITNWWSGYTPYTPYWESIANHTTATWEYYQANVDVEDLKRRVRLLENELATTKERCANLEHIVMNLDAMVHEMKDSIWFRYIDIK